MRARDIASDVLSVLRDEAADGRDGGLSAYEILDRLPGRDALVEECRTQRAGDDAYHLAASLVVKAVVGFLLPEVSCDTAAAREHSMRVGEVEVGGRSRSTAVFRLAA